MIISDLWVQTSPTFCNKQWRGRSLCKLCVCETFQQGSMGKEIRCLAFQTIMLSKYFSTTVHGLLFSLSSSFCCSASYSMHSAELRWCTFVNLDLTSLLCIALPVTQKTIWNLIRVAGAAGLRHLCVNLIWIPFQTTSDKLWYFHNPYQVVYVPRHNGTLTTVLLINKCLWWICFN